MTTSATKLVALLGRPVAHSVSPQIHSAAFDAAGLDLVYLAFDVLPEALEQTLAGLWAMGALGANVTVPHKRAVMEMVDAITREADLVGAANTLMRDGDLLVADNTDALALEEVFADLSVGSGDPVLVFGAGGAARAAAVALGRRAASVEVVARRPEAAAEVADVVRAAGGDARAGLADLADLAVFDDLDRPKAVVNATPLGLHGEALPERYMRLHPRQIALDLVYRPEPTPFLRAATLAGARAQDGLGMLIIQAALAFERWTGQPAPRGAMAQAASRALDRIG